MKIFQKNPRLSSVFLILLCIAASFVFLFAGKSIISDAISYTASTAKKVSDNPQASVDDNFLYDSIYTVAEKGPFTIAVDGQNICVFSGNKRLYRIKANLPEFPVSDRDAIVSGIDIADRASLYEIVEYMES